MTPDVIEEEEEFEEEVENFVGKLLFGEDEQGD
jgi:hypothetical protein